MEEKPILVFRKIAKSWRKLASNQVDPKNPMICPILFQDSEGHYLITAFGLFFASQEQARDELTDLFWKLWYTLNPFDKPEIFEFQTFATQFVF